MTTFLDHLRKGGAAIIACASLLLGCRLEGQLSAIDQPEELKADCQHLLEKNREAGLQPKDWPDSVKGLHPVYVSRLRDSIVIANEAKTGEGAQGYIVSKRRPLDEGSIAVQTGPSDGIYRFHFKPEH